MIKLHRLHGNGAIVVNADLIETIEATPDTVVTLVTKRRFVVEDSVAEVIELVLDFRARIADRITEGSPEYSSASGIAAAASAIAHEEKAA
ncbi:MAG: flagellar FlbD family protein [Gaiellales bacterium]